MPGTSLIALLDDIASILDDVATLTKVAAKNTAGVLGDDLALNAQQVSGVQSARELPVVWAVAKGSLINKAILVPAALALSVFAPWAVGPLLTLGGLYLCFEGVEKLAHRLLHGGKEPPNPELAALSDPSVDLLTLERDKVRGAIRTDFVLSAEIVTIALGSVSKAPAMTRAWVLVTVGLLMTVGVYGVVAGIVKLDDLGLYLNRRGRAASAGPWSALQRGLGGGLLAAAPVLMKALSIGGTVAMFLVGGGIVLHGIPGLHASVHHFVPSGPLGVVVAAVLDAGIGVVAGALALAVVSGARHVLGKRATPAPR